MLFLKNGTFFKIDLDFADPIIKKAGIFIDRFRELRHIFGSVQKPASYRSY